MDPSPAVRIATGVAKDSPSIILLYGNVVFEEAESSPPVPMEDRCLARSATRRCR